MEEMDTDTIGLIVLIIAIAAVFVATKLQERKASQSDQGVLPAFSDPPMPYGLLRK